MYFCRLLTYGTSDKIVLYRHLPAVLAEKQKVTDDANRECLWLFTAQARARTHTHAHTHAHTHTHLSKDNRTEKEVFERRKVFKEDLKEATQVE